MKYLNTYEKYKIHTNNNDLPPHIPFNIGDYVYVKGDKNKNIYQIKYYDQVKNLWFIDDYILTIKPTSFRLRPYNQLLLAPPDEVSAVKYNL